MMALSNSASRLRTLVDLRDMRVYHFVNQEHGLADLCRRRLKIATLNELNDPFELFGVNLGDTSLRRAFRAMKDEVSANRGLLCFSRDWHNPVLWSHYAARHTGVCLGFDIPDEHLGCVTYSRHRLVVDVESLREPRSIPPDLATRFLFTKYSHWRYENEVRAFVSLEDRDPETGFYFVKFSDDLRLTTVIVGAHAAASRDVYRSTLGDLAPQVALFRARLAFRTFRVVRQRNERLWT